MPDPSAKPAAVSSPDRPRYPREVEAAEAILIAKRRQAVPEVPPASPLCGIALSGGGIRSATFSLGVLQGLARLGHLKAFDYLSTVSGGGYIGSFLGGLFCPRGEDGKTAPTYAEVEAGLKAAEAPAQPGPRAIQRGVGWLRENGRYLTPGGSGDAFWAAAAMLRNLLAVHVTMGLLWLLAFLVLDRLGWALGSLPTAHSRYLFLGLEIYRSPWLLSSSAFLFLALVIFGWAFWLVPQGAMKKGPYLAWPVLAVLPLWAWTAATLLLRGHIKGWGGLGAWLGILSLLSLVSLLWAMRFMDGDVHHQDAGRKNLTWWLRLGLVAGVVVAAYGIVDTLGWTLWRLWFQAATGHHNGVRWLEQVFSKHGLIVTAASVLVMFRDKLKGALGEAEMSQLMKRVLPFLLQALVGLSVFGLTAFGLGAVSALSHFMVFGHASPEGFDVVPRGGWEYPLLLLGGLLALILVMSRVIGFLNLSTLGPTYAVALTRAYLGASNPKRRNGDVSSHLVEGDDLPRASYTPWEAGGPLHLINATLNETTGGRSQVTQKDRKGMNLAVGPAGLSVGVRHHALWEANGSGAVSIAKNEGHSVFGQGGQRFVPEALTIGQWMGISGAAVSTGMGSHTSLGRSLWLGILNVRLGYWWWSGLKPGRCFRTFLEMALPVHTHLLEEWTATFPGTHSRHWYLSDGGHFENTAAYELIRRRLPFILLCDNGADADRNMDDLSHLVAKARIDLAAEIRVLDGTGLARRFGKHVPAFLGAIDDLKCSNGEAIAALAEVDYLDASGEAESEGVILILKPTMSPRVPMDLRAYQRVNPLFPQQTTADQFFDEAQWESYRRLGEFLTLEVLNGTKGMPPGTWFERHP